MTKLNDYIDNMFMGLPDSQEVRLAKQMITDNMTGKYEELLGEGKNEAEAFGTTVAEFGSVRELSKEMGWDFWDTPQDPAGATPGNNVTNGESFSVDNAVKTAERAAASLVDGAKVTGKSFSEWWQAPRTASRSKILTKILERFFIIFLVIGLFGEVLSDRAGALFLFAALAAIGLTFYPKSPMYIDTKLTNESSSNTNESPEDPASKG